MVSGYLVKGGRVVDPKSMTVKKLDLRISNGTIAEIGENLIANAGEKVIDAAGKIVMPGLIDTHVHVRGKYAHRMLVRAGVTTALSLSYTGDPEKLIKEYVECGCGLHVGWLSNLTPDTLNSNDPAPEVISAYMDKTLTGGTLGFKILGGHRPITRRAAADCIRMAHERNAWVAFHTGTVETNGDVRGLLEAVELSNGYPLHIAHINSYCRGGVCGPLNEAKLAVDALKLAPNCHCESYLALVNGTSGRFVDENTPFSRVTGNELRRKGYPATRTGILEAIKDGVAKVNMDDETLGEKILADPERGLKYYLEHNGDVTMSFCANSPLAAIALATAKKDNGEYVIASLSTDGGSIPRNLTLHQGLLLVKFGAFTLPEFALKACYNPAIMLGLENRGYLAAGAAADVIVVDEDTMKPDYVWSDGNLVCEHNNILGSGTWFITCAKGEAALKSKGLKYTVVDPAWLHETAPAVPADKLRLPRKTIGILGGLGPIATADLFQKLVKATPASCDQDHPHTVIDNDTLIPDRTAALENRGPSPVPEMIAAARRLAAAGANFIIMPCNTAHAFLKEVAPFVQIPFLNMIELVAKRIKTAYPEVKKVGLLATSGTVKTNLYADALKAEGLEIVLPDEAGQQEVMEAIYSREFGIKAGHFDKSREIMLNQGAKLIARGAGAVILGCTEIPLVVKDGDLSVPAIDTTQVLAESAVEEACRK